MRGTAVITVWYSLHCVGLIEEPIEFGIEYC